MGERARGFAALQRPVENQHGDWQQDGGEEQQQSDRRTKVRQPSVG